MAGKIPWPIGMVLITRSSNIKFVGGRLMRSLIFALLSLSISSPTLSATAGDSYKFRGTEMRDLDAGKTILNWKHQETPIIVRYAARSLEEYGAAAKNGNTFLVGRIFLEKSATVSFYERPKDVIGVYNSTVVVSIKGQPTRIYNVGDIFKNQALSLGYVALVRDKNNEPMLVCNYVGQPSEGPEGFAIIRPLSSGLAFQTLPLTTYGKVVLSRRNLNQIEVWSASPDEVDGANSVTPYSTQLCQLDNGSYRCGPSVRQKESFAPNALIDPAIEILP